MSKRHNRHAAPDVYFPDLQYIKQNDNFIRIGVHQIFIGYNTDKQWMGDDEIIRRINTNIPARFHFFICSEYDMDDKFFKDLEYIVTYFNPAVKVRIHFPYEDKHLLEVFDARWNNNDKRVQALAERKFPEFIPYGGRKYTSSSNDYIVRSALRIVCDKDRIRAEYILYEHSKSYRVGGAILNSAEREDPDKYKDDIIARFKAITPLGILKSFKDEDDIWDYIKTEGEWSIPKGKVTINAKDLGLTKESTMKDYEKAVREAMIKAVKGVIEC